MKLRMLSLLSIVIALTIKSLDISAADYHNLRVFVNAVPDDTYLPIMPYAMETELDSVVYQLATSTAIKEKYVGYNDTITAEFSAFEKLKMLASEEQLNSLLAHESPIVKVYAHRAILDNEMNMNCEAEFALLEDTTCIDWYEGDLLTNTTVKDMIQLAYMD